MDQERGTPPLADATAHYCDLSMICGSAAQIGAELAELPCDEHSPAVSEGIVVRLPKSDNGKCTSCGMKLRKVKTLKDVSMCPRCKQMYSVADENTPRWFVSEEGMAKFVARRIAHNWTQPFGGVFHLGEVNQRDLFFGINPTSEFFTSHNSKEVSVIVGSSAAALPSGWLGSIAFFDELFYYHKEKNELRIAPNICGRILPLNRAGLRRGKNRVIHERRDEWLRFIVGLLVKPYNPKHFYKGVIRQGVVCEWFKRNIPGAPTSPKTYKRDYVQFRTYCGERGERDYRESAIILLLKQAADPKFDRRMEAAQAITELLVQLKKGEESMGHPIEISSEWQYTGDKRGTRTLVAVAPEDDSIDNMKF